MAGLRTALLLAGAILQGVHGGSHVTESARAYRFILSKQVQKTISIWLTFSNLVIHFRLLTFYSPSLLYSV